MADVLLDDNGDLPVQPQIQSGFKVVVQHVRNRLLTHEGEWPLDNTVGFPWLEWFSQKPVPIDEIASVVSNELEQVNGVASIQDVDGELNKSNGVIEMSGTIIGDETAPGVAEFGLSYNVQEQNFHPVNLHIISSR